MRTLSYIPGFLSLIGALVIIIASLWQQIPFSDLCIYTSIVLIIFYIIGLLVQKVFSEAYEDVKEKERQKEIEMQKEKEKQKEIEEQQEKSETRVLSGMDK